MIGGSTSTFTTSTFSGAMSIDELFAVCSVDALDGLDDAALVGLAGEVVALWPRLEAARLRVIAAVEDRAAYRLDGTRDMTSWLAWRAGERRGTARREVELAAAVAVMPAVAAGLDDGSLSKAKAVELGRIARASTDDQARLVEAAKTLPAEQVAREVDRYQLEHAHQPTEIVETLTVIPTAGGGQVEATLSTENLEWVQIAVDAAADQLGLGELTWEQRRAKGLVAVSRYFLDHADLPVCRHGRPTVVVTLDIDVLAARAGGSARLDSGAYLSGEAARRLACDAGIIRMITDPDSMPLDVGRRTRSISPAQARAVIHRDQHCAFEGCTAPPWACDIHHLDFWSEGGHTDVGRLRLGCWHHHHELHRLAATHEVIETADGRLRLEPRRRQPAHPDAA
jgi:hypothetical protein